LGDGIVDSEDNATIENRLSVLLNEYGSLKSEIQYRNQFQNSFISFHITAISLIVGAFFSANLNNIMLLLIPFESLVLGYWYHYQDIKITYIGNYIRDVIEPKARQLVNDHDLMLWEKRIGEERAKNTYKWEGHYKRIVAVTFLLPTVVVLPFVVTSLALIAANWIEFICKAFC
jgi:hypothetical protein